MATDAEATLYAAALREAEARVAMLTQALVAAGLDPAAVLAGTWMPPSQADGPASQLDSTSTTVASTALVQTELSV